MSNGRDGNGLAELERRLVGCRRPTAGQFVAAATGHNWESTLMPCPARIT
jgi:hypothetical protein